MDHCKFCQAELPEDSSVCPSCGRDNAQAEETAEKTQAAPAAEEAQQEPIPEECAEEKNDEAAKLEQTPAQAEKKSSAMKIALAIAGVALVTAVLTAVIVSGMAGKKNSVTDPLETDASQSTAATEETVPATIPEDGNPDDETCKGSYTAEADQLLGAKDTVVASIGDKELTNSQLQVFYWMEVQGFWSSYGSYASYFGLDFSKPLDTQISMEENKITWQQYFLRCALDNWHQMQAMAIAGEEAGLKITEENQKALDELEKTVEAMAASYNVTAEELIRSNFGSGASMEDYYHFQELYFKGMPYYTAETEKLAADDDTLRAYFEEHKEDYTNGGVSEEDLYVDVRHILVKVEGGEAGENGEVTYSDEDWEKCREKAQVILDAYLAGDQTEEAFAALAMEKSEDPGSQAAGGLYQRVYPGQMVEAFNDWCFDAARQTGDYALVQTNYGYHVMYFVSSQPQWRYYAEQDWTTEQTNQMIHNLLEQKPMEVDYSKILLGTLETKEN